MGRSLAVRGEVRVVDVNPRRRLKAGLESWCWMRAPRKGVDGEVESDSF